MPGCSVPLADTTPHLLCQRKEGSFAFSSSFFGSIPNKKVLSMMGIMACSTRVHLPMTCCPQAAITTNWAKKKATGLTCADAKTKKSNPSCWGNRSIRRIYASIRRKDRSLLMVSIGVDTGNHLPKRWPPHRSQDYRSEGEITAISYRLWGI